jgi:Predicted transcriptional regulators
MQIKLGEKIRTLRKQKGISQETLAAALGVTFQSVSKWENAAAMPDVTLIPAIASFFGVSTDELFDFNRYETEEKVMAICRRTWAIRDEHPAEAEAILREGLKQYPGNEILLNNLLCVIPVPERAEEAIAVCRALSEGSKEDDIRLDAWRIMAQAYESLGDYNMMKSALEHIPEIYFTRLQLDAEMLRGAERFEPAHKQKRLSADWTVDMLLILADCYEERGEPEKAAAQLETAVRVIEAFRGDFNVEFFTGTVYENRKDEIPRIRERIGRLRKA